MKLKPTQIVGVIAIVVFGGGMIFRLTQPSEREVMERRLASLPPMEVPEATYPGLDLPDMTLPSDAADRAAASVGALPEVPGYTNLGSQDARDDLYCKAVLAAEFDVKIKTEPDKAEPLLEASRKLEVAGVRKFEAEGVTNADNWASYSVAFIETARADHKAGTLRIPVADCVTRAAKLPG